jgi:hypothetical protein
MLPLIYNLSHVPADTRATIETTPKLRQLFTKHPRAMLRLDGSTKVIKGNRLGFRTAILYLAPASLSGHNVCPMATIAKCAGPCLNTSGRGIMTINQISRLRKTLFWQQYQDEAIAMIKHEIVLFEARAKRQGWTLLVRLNGTSDIRWEQYGIIQAFPNVQFYDYEKTPNRRNIPANYDLTYSYSGVPAFQPYVKRAIAAGKRIAVVFRNRAMVERMLSSGETFLGLPVVDGDDTDIRHLDPRHCVVALYAKGKGKSDQTGFVVG